VLMRKLLIGKVRETATGTITGTVTGSDDATAKSLRP
jgi:hypothetical protein